MKRNKQYILLLITATLILVSGCKTARKATSGREGIFKEKEVFRLHQSKNYTILWSRFCKDNASSLF